MSIVGIGTDLVEIARFARMIERGGRRFLLRWFSSAEVEYCLTHRAPARSIAARFAAKEATLKSLRLPGTGPVRWREIEVTRDADGLAGMCLHGPFRSLAVAAGVTTLHVSMSHGIHYATATVVAVADAEVSLRSLGAW